MQPKQSKKYFHLLTSEEYAQLEKSGATWNDVMRDYLQPAWCNYPDALEGKMGCWSLVDRRVTGEEFCKGCECFKIQRPLGRDDEII